MKKYDSESESKMWCEIVYKPKEAGMNIVRYLIIPVIFKWAAGPVHRFLPDQTNHKNYYHYYYNYYYKVVSNTLP